MTPEVTLWPPRADIYTCTLKSILIHRERKTGGEEWRWRKRKRGSVLKSSALLIAQDLHFLIGVSSDVG